MVQKRGSKYHALSESGRNFGSYSSKGEAEKRIAQMEYFKHKDARKKGKK